MNLLFVPLGSIFFILILLNNFSMLMAFKINNGHKFLFSGKEKFNSFQSSKPIYLNRGLKLNSFSLDIPVLPFSSNKGYISSITSSLFIVCMTIYLAAEKRRFPDIVDILPQNLNKSDMRNAIYNSIKSFIPGLILFSRIVFAKLFFLIELSYKKIKKVIKKEASEIIGREDWTICTLNERESLSSKYIKYRFEFENPKAIASLEVGQEVYITNKTNLPIHYNTI